MTPTIAKECPSCRKYGQTVLTAGQEILCPACQRPWGKAGGVQPLEECPLCRCKQFYTQKDFNQAIGCLIMAVGILLVPKTCGLSLPIFAGIDWLFYRRVKTIMACYKCGAEFRGIPIPPHLKPFMHHIGLKYDKYRK